MATEVRIRRGTTAQHATFTGAVGEITVDTDKDTVVVHDGATVGGFPLSKETIVSGKANSGANSDITSLSGLTTPLSIAQGGTAAITAAAARTSLGAATAGPLASSGITGAAASGANSDITSLSAVTSINGASFAFLPTRQTVLSGPVDTNGFAAFGGATGSTTVTASGTLIATAANGFVAAGQQNYIGSIVNPSWTSLSTNGTMYLYLDIAANGSCTPGSGTLEPTYQQGGTYSVTSGQFTFNIQEMVGKVGNGATAAQTYRVYVGEVTVAGGVVTAIVWYALRGSFTTTTAGIPTNTRLSVNHNLGCKPRVARLAVKCTSSDAGYSVNEEVSMYYANGNILSESQTRLTYGIIANIAAINVNNKTSGANVSISAANWDTAFYVERGW